MISGKMADTGDTIQAVADFLGVKCGKITYDGTERVPVMKGKSGTRKGLATILKHLARAAEKSFLLGDSLEEQAAVDQWLEYRVCNIDRSLTQQDRLTVCKELDTYLADKVYFLSHQLTLIDLALFYGLHQTISELTFYEKQKYMHLSRWYSNVSNRLQSSTEIRQSFQKVPFSRTPLYTQLSGHCHQM